MYNESAHSWASECMLQYKCVSLYNYCTTVFFWLKIDFFMIKEWMWCRLREHLLSWPLWFWLKFEHVVIESCYSYRSWMYLCQGSSNTSRYIVNWCSKNMPHHELVFSWKICPNNMTCQCRNTIIMVQAILNDE